MSILQEVEKIKVELGEQEWGLIEKYIEENPHVLLSDVLYNELCYKDYSKWKEYNSLEIENDIEL